MRQIADYRIEWYEEPLPPLAFDGYAVLRPRAPIPIATGEALYSAWDFKRLLDLSAVDIVQPDLTMCGGPPSGAGDRVAGSTSSRPTIASRVGRWSRIGGGLPFRRLAARLSAQPQHRAAAAD
jgi:hypothetical protein